MVKSLMLAVVLAAAVLSASSAAYAAEEGVARTVEDMAADVTALFPRAEGRVTGAGDGEVSFDIGADDGLKAGMELLLFRQGRPIVHPVTKAVLGNMEEPLGKAVLTEVGEKSSNGRITELLVTRIVEGDTARLPAEPVRLFVVLEDPGYDPVLFDRLMGGLRDSGRFDITGPAEKTEPGPVSGEEAAELSSGNGAGYVLGFTTKPAPEKGRMTVELRLFTAGGAPALDISDTVDATSEVYAESVMDFALVRGDYRDYFIDEDLEFRGKHMAAGDVVGGSGLDIVVSDGQRLVVFSSDDGTLRELWREEGSVSNKHLSVECADLNGNGVDEIYVTNFSGNVMKSYVVEYVDGGFRTVFGPASVMFRVLDVPGSGRMLLTTTKGSSSAYSGVMYEYIWKDGKLERGGRVELPDRIKDPYGFVLVDLVPEDESEDAPGSEKEPFAGLEVVWVDDSDYVQVLDMDDRRLWKSPERYGGYDNFFELDKKSLALTGPDPRGKVKGRLIVREDAAGNKVIVLTRNVPMTYITEKFKGYNTSDIISLVWDGGKMEEGWAIRNIEGYIADIYIGEVAKKGREDILVLVEPTMKIMKKSRTLPLGSIGSIANLIADRSSLMVYKVPLR